MPPTWLAKLMPIAREWSLFLLATASTCEAACAVFERALPETMAPRAKPVAMKLKMLALMPAARRAASPAGGP